MTRSEQTAMIDLGCGRRALPGSWGVDRFVLPEVSVVADLDDPLPFRDNSLDLVYACHSLEHVRDLLAVMGEIWRVCKPGASVVLVAPYTHQALDAVNPYHHHRFNEHTPRFWTEAVRCPVDPNEWRQPPHGEGWGLAASDNRRPQFDLRCIRMEFLYFDRYRNLPKRLQRKLRRTHVGVCDQIIYELVAVKGDVSWEELRRRAQLPLPVPLPDWLEPRRGPLPVPLRRRPAEWLRALGAVLHP